MVAPSEAHGALSYASPGFVPLIPLDPPILVSDSYPGIMKSIAAILGLRLLQGAGAGEGRTANGPAFVP